MPAAADDVEAELKTWRGRLAAASRNVSELSELPQYGAVRAIAGGSGRLGQEARGLVATMDELRQGVLLIGAALDRAEQAHKGSARLWRTRTQRLARPDALVGDALKILHGASITVDLSDTPVLHRRLLAGPRATVTVSPETLLRTMDAAFDRAREQLARITDAADAATSLGARLAAAISRLPAPAELATRLAAVDAPAQATGQAQTAEPAQIASAISLRSQRDPLDRLDALQALSPDVDAALEAFDRAQHGMAGAQRVMTTLQAAAAHAEAAADASTAAVATSLPAVDNAAMRELAAWLDRIGRTLAAGRTDAASLGLSNWQALHDQAAAAVRACDDAARAALARRDELRARLGALRAKRRARAPESAALDALEAAAKATLARTPLDLEQAARDLAAYEAALARR